MISDTESELKALREHAQRLKQENQELRDRLTEARMMLGVYKRQFERVTYDPKFLRMEKQVSCL